MNKKVLLLLTVIFIFSPLVLADYNPLSDEPITDIEEFHQQGEMTKPQTQPRKSYFESNTDGENYEILEEYSIPEADELNESEANEVIEIPPVNSQKTVKSPKNYAQIYNSLEIPKHSYLHNIDPDQYYDIKDTSWSPYPLLRLNSPIYFKSITIEPGYYLLTPREHKGKWYLLFKQNGNVAHIIPVYERDITPEFFYDKHLPKPKLTPSQKMHMGFLDFLGKFDSTKRREPIKSYMEINDLENHFLSIIIYYGNHKYSTLFRSVKL